MGDRELKGDLEVKGVFVHVSPGSPTRFRLARINYAPFEARVGNASITAATLRTEGLRNADSPTQATRVVVEAAFATDVVIKMPGVAVSIERLELSRGFRVKRDGEILIPALQFSGIELTLDPVLSGKRTDRSGPHLVSWQFLDALFGHLNVDLFVDLNGPLIGRRTETHEFRVAIRDGSIDYDALERDVHWLERSFLDIEVADTKLVLERNLPLIPFSSKALLWWPLDADELRLAWKKRVKLRTLLGWEVPPEERGRRSKGSSIQLNQIAARDIDIGLDVQGPTEIDFGDGGKVKLGHDETGIERLQITGSILYDANAAATHTILRAVLMSLPCALDRLGIGGVRVSADRIDFDDIDDCTLSFEGLMPTTLSASAAAVRAATISVVRST